MDVTSQNFWQIFPEVVGAFARADFVAVDLEMTGIISKEAKTAKPSVEDVYERARKAAQTHQIIQFGLTCVYYVDETDVHESKTYNFFLNPMFPEASRVTKTLGAVLDRHVVFSSSSYQFLSKFGFDFDKAFKDGVTFISRQEAEELGTTFLRRNRREIPGFDLGQHDEVVRDFYKKAETTIRAWLAAADKDDGTWYTNIDNPHGGKMTGFQISLVNHLVETEFPKCQARPRHGDMFIQVTMADMVAKEKTMMRQLEERREAVIRQTGFRYLIDALVGKLFTEDLRPEWMIDSDSDKEQSAKDIAVSLKKCEAKLTTNPPIVVGHNQLYDLCFLYQTFIGDLPTTLETFRTKIHTLFPRMVDTKFLATPPNYHVMMADESLPQLFEIAKDQELPVIMPDAVLGPHMLHQAGYDSWMTAVVFLKKSWNLAGDATMKKNERRDWHGNVVQIEEMEEKPKDSDFGKTIEKAEDVEEKKPMQRDFGALRDFYPKAAARRTSLSGSIVKTDHPSPVKSQKPSPIKADKPSPAKYIIPGGRWLGPPPPSINKPRPAHESGHQLKSDTHYWPERRTLPDIARRNIPKNSLKLVTEADSEKSLLDGSDTDSEDEFGQKWPVIQMDAVLKQDSVKAFVRASFDAAEEAAKIAHEKAVEEAAKKAAEEASEEASEETPKKAEVPITDTNPNVHNYLPFGRPSTNIPILAPMLSPVLPGAPVLVPLPVRSVRRGSVGPSAPAAAPVTSLMTVTTSSHRETPVASPEKDVTDTESDSDLSESQHRIPVWGSAFWKKYGNKIRVGTSGSLDLATEFVPEKKDQNEGEIEGEIEGVTEEMLNEDAVARIAGGY